MTDPLLAIEHNVITHVNDGELGASVAEQKGARQLLINSNKPSIRPLHESSLLRSDPSSLIPVRFITLLLRVR